MKPFGLGTIPATSSTVERDTGYRHAMKFKDQILLLHVFENTNAHDKTFVCIIPLL